MRFALEVHPTEIAFDVSSAQRALDAIGNRAAFGFNYDPSHFGYQGVDYLAFIDRFADRIYHVHMKDVWWSDRPKPSGVFGGHLAFGHPDRFWEFRSLGRGRIDFEEVIRRLNAAHYDGPLSVEWEDIGMDREHGARKPAPSCARWISSPPRQRSTLRSPASDRKSVVPSAARDLLFQITETDSSKSSRTTGRAAPPATAPSSPTLPPR